MDQPNKNRIYNSFKFHDIKNGGLLFHEKDNLDNIYSILKGKIAILKNNPDIVG